MEGQALRIFGLALGAAILNQALGIILRLEGDSGISVVIKLVLLMAVAMFGHCFILK